MASHDVPTPACSHTILDVLLDPKGTADNTVPYKYASRVQSLVPQAELITIEDGGHDLTISHPDTITSEFVRFFESASS